MDHSDLRARVGSMRVARRAGMNEATAIATTNTAAASAKATGSHGLIANSCAVSIRDPTNEINAPTTTPTIATRIVIVGTAVAAPRALAPQGDEMILIAHRQVANENRHRDGGHGRRRPDADSEERDRSGKKAGVRRKPRSANRTSSWMRCIECPLSASAFTDGDVVSVRVPE